MEAKKKDLAKLFSELEEIVSWFEESDVDLDEALLKFKRGLQISKELKESLKKIDNQVKTIREDFKEVLEDSDEVATDESF